MAELQTGTLTFVFTDLERSTGLWEEHPEAMRQALARHDAILRGAVEAHDGHVVKTTGDGVHAVFASARDALAASLDAQRALTTERWPEVTGPLRVRIGVHTGEAEFRDGDYYGSALNRAARLMASAHGGQIVVSRVIAELVRDDLAAGVELVDLGEHHLRDLSRPEQVFQVAGPGLERDFPRLASLDVLPGNLPVQPTSFVGRDDDIAAITAALDEARLVTLTGVGGAGKTRLALQVAAALQPGFRHGAWLCELAPLTSPDAVGPLLAGVLSVELATHDGWLEAIVERLASRELLLVLDNCEHVLDSTAAITDALVKRCPEVVVLATSREGLGVAGERIMPIGSLAIPGVDDPPEVARATDAVSLFVSRAHDVRPLAVEDHEMIATVAEVCRRLDGIPLAIELAAARTQSMSVVEIARHLDHRLDLLTRGARSALGRHQTLRAAIDWSFELLNAGEQRLLTRASVFAGGFTLDAAAAVCNPGTMSAIETLDHVDGLVRRSMLGAEEAAGTTRYRMLETIRQYGAERLEALGDAAETRRMFLEWCTTFAHEVGERLRSADDAAWLARLERELDNVRAALQLAVSSGDLGAAKALLAPAPVGALWDARLGVSMAELAKEVAPMLGEPDHPVSAALLSLRSLDAAVRFAGDEAVMLAERACVVARRHDDWIGTGPWMAWLLSSLIAGRYETVMGIAQEALARAVSDDDPFAVAEWQAQLGIAHWIAGDVGEAQRLTEIGLTLAEKIGADNLVMRNAFLRGTALLVPESDPAISLRYFQQAVGLGERVGGNVLYGGAAWAMLLSNRRAADLSAAALARELASNLATPMFLVDADAMMVFFNDATAAIIGKTFSEVGEIPATEFGEDLELGTVDGEPLRKRDSVTGVAFFQRRPVHQTIMATGYDGRRHTLHTSAYPLFGPAGEFQGVVTVFWEHMGATNDRQ
jgi:predicted ATPase/class 3 adenylate cyclase